MADLSNILFDFEIRSGAGVSAGTASALEQGHGEVAELISILASEPPSSPFPLPPLPFCHSASAKSPVWLSHHRLSSASPALTPLVRD